jgi:prefoldin subunit 5
MYCQSKAMNRAHMTEVDLNFLARQLERLQTDMQHLRRDMHFLREEVRLSRGQIARIEDAITMDILDRLRALETRDAR